MTHVLAADFVAVTPWLVPGVPCLAAGGPEKMLKVLHAKSLNQNLNHNPKAEDPKPHTPFASKPSPKSRAYECPVCGTHMA